MLAAGTGIWLELTSAPQGPGRLPRPARAAMAAAAMWTIWVLAYLTGMSGASWLATYRHGAPGGLGAAADQQIAVAILWAVPALCFLPVLYVTVVAWAGRQHQLRRERAPGRIRQHAGRLASPAARLALTALPVIIALRPPASGRKLPPGRPRPRGSRCHRREPGPVTYGGR